MVQIELEHVDVHFPIFSASSRSFKNAVIHKATGGRIKLAQDRHVIVEALSNISLNFAEGSRVALVGSNGAGKSTLLRILAGVYYPTEGSVTIRGNISSVFDIHLGMDQEATGYENIVLRGMLLGMSKKTILRSIDNISEFTELGDYLNMPIRTYSDGMRLRLAFAISTNFRPEILLMDEGILAGDAKFIEKARIRLDSFIRSSSIFVLASHSDEIVREFCNLAVWLDSGKVQAIGGVDEVLLAYRDA